MGFDGLADCPDEAEQFTTDYGSDGERRFPALDERAIASTETMLCFGGDGDRTVTPGVSLVAAAELKSCSRASPPRIQM